MTTKLLTMSELTAATYGSFSREGVRVDLSDFFRTPTGRRAIEAIGQVTPAGPKSAEGDEDCDK